MADKTNKVNLAFYVDDSEAYLDNKLKQTIEDWGYTQADCITTNEWKTGCASVNGFFNKFFIHLNLRDTKDLKTFVEQIDKGKKTEFANSDWIGNGVIITATNQKSSGKIAKLTEKFGGILLQKRKPEEIKKEMLETLSLKKNIVAFLSEFAGDDYELLFSCLNTLKSIPKEDRINIAIEELYAYLPAQKGAIPPWEYVDCILSDDLAEAISKLKRTLLTNHYLVALVMLKNKMSVLYQYTLANLDGYKTDKEKANALGMANIYPFFSFKKLKRQPSLQTVEYINKLIHKAEEDLKGGLRIDGNLYMEVIVNKIVLALRYNAVLEKI